MVGLLRLARELWKTARSTPKLLDLGYSSRLGRAALAAAVSEIGKGEQGRNNAGPDVERYRRHRGPRGAWCAAFICFAIEKGARALGRPRPMPRIHNAKRLFRAVLKNGGIRVEEPRPGDLVLWHRGASGARTGHIGIVSEVDLDSGLFWAIEGNKGRYPSRVDSYNHQVGEGGLLGFARLP